MNDRLITGSLQSLCSVLFHQESIVDASEDSQLRAAIAASLACTTSALNDESDDDDDDDDEDEDFDDLEFTESDSEEECKTPQKNNNKSSTTVKKEVKRGINFEESTDKSQEAYDEGNQISQNEHLKCTDSVKNKSTAGVETNTSYKLENSEAEVSKADSTSEEKDESSNYRTQEQAGKRLRVWCKC